MICLILLISGQKTLPEPSPGSSNPATGTGRVSAFCPSKRRDRILSDGQQVSFRKPGELRREDKPEAEVVVPVAGRVPVPVGRTAVGGVVVPAAAPVDTVGASQDRTPNFSMIIRLKRRLSPAFVKSVRGSKCRISSFSDHIPSQ